MANEIVVSDPNFLMPAASVQSALVVYQAKKEFIEGVLRQGVDYGAAFPGSDKPTLLKPGAEKMVSFFGLSPVFEDIETIEDWTGEHHGGEPFFYYRQKCKLYKGDRLIATADGSCNSWEKKYRYRSAERVCPQCGNATIFRSKNKPEFYCWAKKGGCGATFRLDDQRIIGQELGQVKNPDVAEQTNTILKISQKRALVAAVLIGTAVSDYFTQDAEDFVQSEVIDVQFRDITHQSSASRPADVISAELGYDIPPEPPSQAAPEIEYPIELAVVTNSQGVPYVDLDNEKLGNMLNGIEKALTKPNLTDDQISQYNAKHDAIRQILAIRNGK